MLIQLQHPPPLSRTHDTSLVDVLEPRSNVTNVCLHKTSSGCFGGPSVQMSCLVVSSFFF